jgi:hypothetical protein
MDRGALFVLAIAATATLVAAFTMWFVSRGGR